MPVSGPPGRPITMAELHQSGGVPHGWQFRLSPGDPVVGRQAFIDFGCPTCHTVQGEHFPAVTNEGPRVGPDLSGMGGHHPASYFAESIVNPNAVLVDGPGYITADGRSAMPSYPDMTVLQLTNVVAYLQSLRDGEKVTRHSLRAAGGATVFFVQAYTVHPDRLDEFYDWFEAQRFREYSGLVSIDSYVGPRAGELLAVCIFGFDNEVSAGRFIQQLDTVANTAAADFVRPADHYILRSPPVYRALGLIAP
jgi:mono/diheme cytochrome c family protein